MVVFMNAISTKCAVYKWNVKFIQAIFSSSKQLLIIIIFTHTTTKTYAKIYSTSFENNHKEFLIYLLADKI